MSTAYSTGTNIGAAFQAIKLGQADIMLAGGSEYTSIELGMVDLVPLKHYLLSTMINQSWQMNI